MSDTKLMTSLYSGIGKYTHWVAGDFSNTNNYVVRYSPNSHPQNNQHQRTAHWPRSRSTVSLRRTVAILTVYDHLLPHWLIYIETDDPYYFR